MKSSRIDFSKGVCQLVYMMVNLVIIISSKPNNCIFRLIPDFCYIFELNAKLI